MELRQLRYFVTLAEDLHFRRAAERMHIAQPAFSEQIRRLEADLGARLFDRTSHYVRLTEAGRLFLVEVRLALTQVDHAAAVAARAGRGVLGSLTIGFCGAAANELTPLILRRFGERHPDVAVKLREFGFADPSAGLAGRQADLAFVRPPVPSTEPLELVTLFVEPRMAVMAADHRLATEDGLMLDELADEPFVAGPLSSCGLAERAPDTVRTATTDEWLAMIAAGAGVSLAPASTARFHGRPGIRFVPMSDLQPSVLALARRAEDETPAVGAFVEAARAVAREEQQPSLSSGDRVTLSRKTDMALEP